MGNPAPIGESIDISTSVAKRAWARLIKQVYEVDPLVCPRGRSPMRILAVIEQPEGIAKILTPLPACADGRQGVVAHPRPQPAEGYPLPSSGERVIGA